MEGYTGEIRMFAGDYAPENWAFCQGQLIPTAQNPALFSLLGTYFGGDGQVNFKLPDLQGRCAVGAGQGPGLYYYHLGDKYGTEEVIIDPTTMPTHNHTAIPNLTGKVRCNDQQSDNESPVGNSLAVFKEDKNAYNTQAPDADMSDNTVKVEGSVTLSPAGASQPHTNMQPSFAINYIICLYGIFPPRP